MSTIVEYSERKLPRNAYPVRIVSPPAPALCCSSHMEAIGEPQEESRWFFQYRRCASCGFTVRLVLRAVPDAALLGKLRRTLATAFARSTHQERGLVSNGSVRGSRR